MAFRPINLGNIIQQGEAIQGSRLNNLRIQNAMDPASPENQLQRLQIQQAQQQINPESLQNRILEAQFNKANQPADTSYTLAPGASRYDQSGLVQSNPSAPKQPTGIIAEYQNALKFNLVPDGTSLPDYIKLKKPTGVTINTGNQTPGRTELDKTFAKEYSSLVASGGFADLTKQIKQLQGVSNKLSKSDTITGPWVGSVPDWLQTFINPAATAAREDVEEVVQRNLRLILGAQFTNEEGKRLIARAYNPRLEEGENKIRIDRLIAQMSEAAKAKIDAAKYFGANGTLTGFAGKVWSIDDFDLGEERNEEEFDFKNLSNEELDAMRQELTQ